VPPNPIPKLSRKSCAQSARESRDADHHIRRQLGWFFQMRGIVTVDEKMHCLTLIRAEDFGAHVMTNFMQKRG
jgi:hypothetical protein